VIMLFYLLSVIVKIFINLCKLEYGFTRTEIARAVLALGFGTPHKLFLKISPS
jgi:hypothetical protein